MSDTAFTTSSEQAIQLWLAGLHRAQEIKSFWGKFMSKKPGSPIYVKDKFVYEPGYRLKFDLVEELAMSTDGPTAGVTNGTTLWAGEEALNFDQETLDIFLMRNGVRFTQYSQQLVVHDILKQSETALELWGINSLDKMIFNGLAGKVFKVAAGPDLIDAADNTNIIYGGTATSEATIADTDIFDTSCIDRAKEAALTGDINGTGIWRIRPINVDGAQHYICVVHPNQAFDLREDEKWIEAQKHANVRGSKNPIFNGALGIWNDVILYQHNYIRKHTDWGSGGVTPGATALFCGAQAGCLAKAQVDGWDVGFQDFDYTYKKSGGFLRGVSLKWFGGFVKSRFADNAAALAGGATGTDFGVIAIKTYAKSHAVDTA